MRQGILRRDDSKVQMWKRTTYVGSAGETIAIRTVSRRRLIYLLGGKPDIGIYKVGLQPKPHS